MSEDLISNNFTDNIDSALIRRMILFCKIILSLFIVYSILELTSLYIPISKTFNKSLSINLNIYAYRIQPFVHSIVLAIGLINWNYFLKAHNSILLSIENSDAELFNAGYHFFFKAIRLGIFSVSIAVINVFIIFLLKQF